MGHLARIACRNVGGALRDEGDHGIESVGPLHVALPAGELVEATRGDVMELGIKLGERTVYAVREFCGVPVAPAYYLRFGKNRRRTLLVRGDCAAALLAIQHLPSPSASLSYAKAGPPISASGLTAWTGNDRLTSGSSRSR